VRPKRLWPTVFGLFTVRLLSDVLSPGYHAEERCWPCLLKLLTESSGSGRDGGDPAVLTRYQWQCWSRSPVFRTGGLEGFLVTA